MKPSPTIDEMERMLDGLAELSTLYPDYSAPISLWFEWVEKKIAEAEASSNALERLRARTLALRGPNPATKAETILG